MPPSPDNNESRIGMRELPCACASCLRDDYDACVLRNIVGTMNCSTMYFKEKAGCPDSLTLPLAGYNIPVLKAFLKLYNVKLPKTQNKADLILTITQFLPQYLNVEVPANE